MEKVKDFPTDYYVIVDFSKKNGRNFAAFFLENTINDPTINRFPAVKRP